MNRLDLIKKEAEKLYTSESAHDRTHIMRVYKNAELLCEKENTDPELVLTAVLFHDVVLFKKTDPKNIESSTASAKKAKEILSKYNYTDSEIDIITDAIRDHSFSKKRTPKTIHGKILQDADRLDALGAIGIARVFAVAGAERRPLYNLDDPFCQNHIPDDTKWSLDHFYRKLVKLEEFMNTETGRSMARQRIAVLYDFLDQLKKELG